MSKENSVEKAIKENQKKAQAVIDRHNKLESMYSVNDGSKLGNRTKLDKDYINLLLKIINEGIKCTNRTGVDTLAISGHMIEHDMSKGFPILTIKKVLFDVLATELEGFIKGITRKEWFQERGCNIWDLWHNPKSDDHNDLGPIYGYQWRNFNSDGLDQFKVIIDCLKENSDSRRLICSAWNPNALPTQALPPCHVMWQVCRYGDKLDLCWYQRSVDTPLGLPFNIASYGLLLELICKEVNLKPGKLIGFLNNVHIYENQNESIIEKLIPQANENKLNITTLPKLIINDTFTSIYDFDAKRDVKLEGYNHDAFVKIPITA